MKIKRRKKHHSSWKIKVCIQNSLWFRNSFVCLFPHKLQDRSLKKKSANQNCILKLTSCTLFLVIIILNGFKWQVNGKVLLFEECGSITLLCPLLLPRPGTEPAPKCWTGLGHQGNPEPHPHPSRGLPLFHGSRVLPVGAPYPWNQRLLPALALHCSQVQGFYYLVCIWGERNIIHASALGMT